MLAKEPRVGGRDGFAQLVARHPINAHGLARLRHTGEIANDVHELARLWRATHLAGRRDVRRMRRLVKRKAQLKKAVTISLEAMKHRTAERHRLNQGRSFDVLDYIGPAASSQELAGGLNKVGVLTALDALREAVRLARWAGVDRVKARQEVRCEGQNVALDELERIPALRLDIDADNLKARLGIASASAARFAEQIEEARL